MKKNRSKKTSLIQRPVLNRITPTNDQQQHYETNKKQSISSQHEQSSYNSSFTDKIELSASQFSTISGTFDRKGRSNTSLINSGHYHRFHELNDKNAINNQRIERLENWITVIGIFFTVVTLTVFLLSIYLYTIINETQKTTTATLITTTTLTTTTTSQIQLNQTNSSETAKPYYCSGVSPYTLWSIYFTSGITMVVDTSNCSFTSVPLYFTSMGGTSNHFELGGYTAIYSPTNHSFVVYVLPLVTYANTLMLSDSQLYHWDLNWVGILN